MNLLCRLVFTVVYLTFAICWTFDYEITRSKCEPYSAFPTREKTPN